MAKELTEQWNLPSYIIAFLANSLDQDQKGRVLPWPHFRKLLYSVINDRIDNSQEIYGSVNSNYLSLEEYLIIYFIKE